MGELSRIGIALDSDLLKRFDRSIEKSGYTNRSEAFRDLIRDRLVREQTAAPDSTVVGTVTLIFNHHASGITEKLTEAQHEPVTRTWTSIPALKYSSSTAVRPASSTSPTFSSALKGCSTAAW
jgi:metal-responsive CopG/Arc/MetJ family transcriptional regulator